MFAFCKHKHVNYTILSNTRQHYNITQIQQKNHIKYTHYGALRQKIVVYSFFRGVSDSCLFICPCNVTRPFELYEVQVMADKIDAD